VASVRHECIAPTHDHTTWQDRDGNTLTEPVLMFCQDCGKPTHYDYAIDDYQHDDEAAPDCFLVKRRAVGTAPCHLEIPAGENPYADLDPVELAEAVGDFGGDMAAAADHLRRLRQSYSRPPQGG
jgi:hypothetical protein